jgi:hypothetical protein
MRKGLIGGSILLAVGCGGGGGGAASYPDKGDVAKAQGEWCKELSKIKGGDSWDQMGACKAAYPAASAAYLRKMAKCFFGRLAELGDKAPDHTQLVTDCNDEVTVMVPTNDAASAELIDARCERMEKCEKVPVAECKSAYEHLESAQRAMFTTIYNRAAQHEIAQCLSSKGCTEDEEAAKEACYRATSDRLLWFGP